MDLSSIDVFALAGKRLAWIDQRQAVLAQNIANANTPGYAARDITPFSAVLAAEAERAGGDSTTRPSPAASGNSLNKAVVLDEQLEKVAETDTAQQLTANLYKKYVGLFKTAIGRG